MITVQTLAEVTGPGVYLVAPGVVLAWTGDLDLTGVTLVASSPGRVMQSLGGQGPCSIVGVRILAPTGAWSEHAISIHDATEATVRDVVVEGCGGDGVYIGARVGSALVEDVDVTNPARHAVTTRCPVVVVRRVRSTGGGDVVHCERGRIEGAVSVLIEDCEGDGRIGASGWGAGGYPLPIATVRRCRVPEVVIGGIAHLEVEDSAIPRIRRSGQYVGSVTITRMTVPWTVA